MKKLVLLFAVIIICFTGFGQGGFQPIKAEMKANEFKGNTALYQKACENTLNVGTPNNWTSVGSVPTIVSTFYNHTNWLAISNPQNKTYQFKRLFYIGRAGTYTISVKGMGDNRMVLKVNNSNAVFDKDVVANAAGFNTPASKTINVELQCGMNELNVEITNYESSAGFYLDGTISSKNGCIGDEMLACEVFKEVCRCPTGWLSNTSNKDGDITTDGYCKKMFCKLEGLKPLPPNGTIIGTAEKPYGFTWGDGIYFAGTKENGGASICKKEWVNENPSPNPNVKPGEGRGEK